MSSRQLLKNPATVDGSPSSDPSEAQGPSSSPPVVNTISTLPTSSSPPKDDPSYPPHLEAILKSVDEAAASDFLPSGKLLIGGSYAEGGQDAKGGSDGFKVKCKAYINLDSGVDGSLLDIKSLEQYLSSIFCPCEVTSVCYKRGVATVGVDCARLGSFKALAGRIFVSGGILWRATCTGERIVRGGAERPKRVAVVTRKQPDEEAPKPESTSRRQLAAAFNCTDEAMYVLHGMAFVDVMEDVGRRFDMAEVMRIFFGGRATHPSRDYEEGKEGEGKETEGKEEEDENDDEEEEEEEGKEEEKGRDDKDCDTESECSSSLDESVTDIIIRRAAETSAHIYVESRFSVPQSIHSVALCLRKVTRDGEIGLPEVEEMIARCDIRRSRRSGMLMSTYEDYERAHGRHEGMRWRWMLGKMREARVNNIDIELDQFCTLLRLWMEVREGSAGAPSIEEL